VFILYTVQLFFDVLLLYVCAFITRSQINLHTIYIKQLYGFLFKSVTSFINDAYRLFLHSRKSKPIRSAYCVMVKTQTIRYDTVD